MKRNDDLIRELMLHLENASGYTNDSTQIGGYARDEIAYHLALIHKQGFAEGPGAKYSSDGYDPTIPAVVLITRLTPAGHDFIANLRDDAVWEQVKSRSAKAGGSLSLDILGQLGGAVIKQIIGLS